jgi:TonB family protein
MVATSEFLVSVTRDSKPSSDVWECSHPFELAVPGGWFIHRQGNGFVIVNEDASQRIWLEGEEAALGLIVSLPQGNQSAVELELKISSIENDISLLGRSPKSISEVSSPIKNQLVISGQGDRINETSLFSKKFSARGVRRSNFHIKTKNNIATITSKLDNLYIDRGPLEPLQLKRSQIFAFKTEQRVVVRSPEHGEWWQVVPSTNDWIDPSAKLTRKQKLEGLAGATIIASLFALILLLPGLRMGSPSTQASKEIEEIPLKITLVKAPRVNSPTEQDETDTLLQAITPPKDSIKTVGKAKDANSSRVHRFAKAKTGDKKAELGNAQLRAALAGLTDSDQKSTHTPKKPMAAQNKLNELHSMQANSKAGLGGTRGSVGGDSKTEDSEFRNGLRPGEVRLASVGLVPGDYLHESAHELIPSRTRILGGLTETDVESTIGKNELQIRNCYQTALASHPGLTGKITLNFLVTGDGKVSTARVTASTINEPHLGSCLVSLLKGFDFPAPRDGGRVNVSYPFVFQLVRGGK